MKRNFAYLVICILFLKVDTCYAIDTVKLVQSSLPSLVVIEVFDSNNNFAGQGSGFFVTNNGDIVTNAHVVTGSTRILIYTNDNNSFRGQLKAINEEQDIALLSIPSKNYRPLNVLDTTPPAGSYALALGAPLGLMNTISDGLVSGIKYFRSYPFIQVSCPISPGSSGGPIINDKGHVIGMSTFLLPAGNNLSFAVPPQQIKNFVNQSKKIVVKDPNSYLFKPTKPKPEHRGNNKPKERYVFMLKHNEERDGYIESYIDTHSVVHNRNIISFMLLSKVGRKLSRLFSKNGVLAEVQKMNVEINTANRTSRVVKSSVYDSQGNLLHTSKDGEEAKWEPIRRGTSINEYLSYILLSGL